MPAKTANLNPVFYTRRDEVSNQGGAWWWGSDGAGAGCEATVAQTIIWVQSLNSSSKHPELAECEV